MAIKPIKAIMVVMDDRTTLHIPVAVVADATRVALGDI